MGYLDIHLSHEDNWVNKCLIGVKFPNDAAIKDPDKLAKLSGPVNIYYLGDVSRNESLSTN